MIYERKINYYETDAMQIVHHSNYIRFMEESRTDALERIGLPYNEMERQGVLIPVLGVNCQYKHPARYGDTVLVNVGVKEYSGVKIIMEYTITNKATGEILVTGETKHCLTDTNLKPISLKKSRPDMHEKMIELMNTK